jgi:hypothetical protein
MRECAIRLITVRLAYKLGFEWDHVTEERLFDAATLIGIFAPFRPGRPAALNPCPILLTL